MIGDQRGAVAHADVGDAGFPEFLIEEFLVLLVQRAGGLVEERELRFPQEQPGERDALLLAQREHVVPLHQPFAISLHTQQHVRQVHFLQHREDFLLTDAPVRIGIHQLITQAALDHVGALGQEHELVRRRPLQMPAGSRPQSGDRAQHGTLPGSARAHDQQALASMEVEGQFLHQDLLHSGGADGELVQFHRAAVFSRLVGGLVRDPLLLGIVFVQLVPQASQTLHSREVGAQSPELRDDQRDGR